MSTSNRVQQALDRVEDRTHETANGTAQVDAAVLAEEVKRLRDERADVRAALTVAKLPDGVPLALGVKRLASLLGDVEKERDALRAEVATLNIYRQRREPILTALGGAREECAALRAEVERLTIECDAARKAAEELRLTLLAEQGNAEGAPEGWKLTGSIWYRPLGPVNHQAEARRSTIHPNGEPYHWTLYTPTLTAEGYAPTARAAMQAADHNLFESRQARRIARALKLKTDGVFLWPPNGAHQQTPAIMLDHLTDPNLTEAVLAVYEALL